jgi:hypothetical protein
MVGNYLLGRIDLLGKNWLGSLWDKIFGDGEYSEDGGNAAKDILDAATDINDAVHDKMSPGGIDVIDTVDACGGATVIALCDAANKAYAQCVIDTIGGDISECDSLLEERDRICSSAAPWIED